MTTLEFPEIFQVFQVSGHPEFVSLHNLHNVLHDWARVRVSGAFK